MPRTLRSVPFMQAATIAFLGVASSTSSFAQAQLQTQVTPQMRSEAMAVMHACRADYDRLCGDVVPGGGRILACLQSHAGEISPTCAQAMPRAQTLRDRAITAGVMPK